MNSLTYLSRQLDDLALSRRSGKLTSDQDDTTVGRLKRTRTWNKPFLQGLQSSPSPHAKRSFSLPAFAQPRSAATATTRRINGIVSSSEDSSDPKCNVQRVRRFYFIRALLIIWSTICEAWHYIVKHIHRPWWSGPSSSKTVTVAESEIDDATSVEEKDSEDSEDSDPIVTRSVPKRTKQILLDDQQPLPSPSIPNDTVREKTKSKYPDTKDSPSFVSPRYSSLLPNPFTSSLLTRTSVSATPSRSPSPLPHLRKTPFHLPKTLVLDLDETLIHSTSKPLTSHTGGTGLLGLGGRRNKGTGHMVEVVLGGRSTLYHVYKRPFVDYFLRKVVPFNTAKSID